LAKGFIHPIYDAPPAIRLEKRGIAMAAFSQLKRWGCIDRKFFLKVLGIAVLLSLLLSFQSHRALGAGNSGGIDH
jgi:hypothetical protein